MMVNRETINSPLGLEAGGVGFWETSAWSSDLKANTRLFFRAAWGPKCPTQPDFWEEKEGCAQQWGLLVQASGAQWEMASRQRPPAQPERRWESRQAAYLAVFHHIVQDGCPAATLMPRPPHELV